VIAPALVFPVRDWTGTIHHHIARPYVARIREGRQIKYEAPKGSSLCVDVHPARRRPCRKSNPPGDFGADTILNEVQGRRRRVQYIGNEHEYDRLVGSKSAERYLWLIHPAGLRGPSER